MGVMELFTEFEKMQRRPSTDAANLAPFRMFFPFNMGKSPKKCKKLNLYPKILSTGRSQNSNFGFLVRFYDTLRTDEAGF